MSSLGLVETKSIAHGIGLADTMVKRADVVLLRAHTICSGRFMILVAGERAAVGEAMELAVEAGRKVFARHLLSSVSGEVVDALANRFPIVKQQALGVVESKNVISGISAADIAVKAAVVKVVRLVCGQGINGKSYFILNGEVADVEVACGAVKKMLGNNLFEIIIIPSPDSALIRTILAGRGGEHGESVIRAA